MDLQTLIDLDKELLLMLNGSSSLYLDQLVRTLTNAWTWVPLYISLFYVVLKNSDSMFKVFAVLACAGLCVLIAGTVDDALVKPLVARWRPARDPQIGLLVDIVDGYRGGKYGFFSAHASNTFSIAIFFCWLVRSRLLSLSLVVWSLVNCWTRLYLGVHFPGDILVGLCWGAITGSLVYWLFLLVMRRMGTVKRYASDYYTVTGFQRGDAIIPVVVLTLTFIYTLLRACFA